MKCSDANNNQSQNLVEKSIPFTILTNKNVFKVTLRSLCDLYQENYKTLLNKSEEIENKPCFHKV